MKSEDNVAINSRGARKGFGLALVVGGVGRGAHKVFQLKDKIKERYVNYISCVFNISIDTANNIMHIIKSVIRRFT